LNKIFSVLGKIIRAAILMGLTALIVPRLVTAIHAYTRVYILQEAPPSQFAIVFGAGLWWDGQPTPVLRDRVATAAELYRAGKVTRLLLSGSQSGTYNEPEAMRSYAISLGVPAEAIQTDNAGDRTYDTCYRALKVYDIHSAILVTQNFHLPRALYTCNQLGIEVSGVAADRGDYRRSTLAYWNLRELLATLTAMVDIHLLHPLPIVSDPPTSVDIPLID